MIPPQLDDADGHEFKAGALGVSYAAWNMRCIDEIVTAHAEGRKLSFRVPSFHDGGPST